MCVLHVHSAIPLGTCQWAQLRWEVAAPTDALLQERWPGGGGSGAAAGAGSAGPRPYGTGSWPPRSAHPWLRVKLGKISLLRMTDRQSARQARESCGAPGVGAAPTTTSSFPHLVLCSAEAASLRATRSQPHEVTSHISFTFRSAR